MRGVLMLIAVVGVGAGAPAAPICQPRDLTANTTETGAGMCHIYTTVLLRNASSRACSLRGVPMVEGFDQAGKAVPATVTGNSDVNALGAGSNEPLLPAGGVAAFVVETVNQCFGDPPHHCPSALHLRLAGRRTPGPLNVIQQLSCDEITLSGFVPGVPSYVP